MILRKLPRAMMMTATMLSRWLFNQVCALRSVRTAYNLALAHAAHQIDFAIRAFVDFVTL
jgi:hypothetical protein